MATNLSLIIEINHPKTGRNHLRQAVVCDDVQEMRSRIQRAIEWYGHQQGCAVAWRSTDYWGDIRKGSWHPLTAAS